MDNKLNEVRRKISFLRSEMLKAEDTIRKQINRDLDLREERLRPRIDPLSAAARSTRPDPKILTLITCHDATIDIGKC